MSLVGMAYPGPYDPDPDGPDAAENRQRIADLLIGRRIVRAEQFKRRAVHLGSGGDVEGFFAENDQVRADGLLTLDDGTEVYVRGHEGGCACSAGCYFLTHLSTVENVITAVKFVDHPSGDDWPDREVGFYRIFVLAGNEQVNILSVDGSDGNGWYGTGYELFVRPVDDMKVN